MASDLKTKEGWEAFLKYCCEKNARRSEEKERTIPDIVLFVTRHPLTGEPFSMPMGIVLIGPFTDADESKDKFMNLARAISVAGDCFASVFSHEMWFAIATQEEMEGKVPVVRPSQRKPSERQEGVVMMCEHRDFCPNSFVSIITTKGKRRIVGEWSQESIAESRFAGVVGKPGVRISSVDRFMVQMYLKEKIARGEMSDLIMLNPEDVLN